MMNKKHLYLLAQIAVGMEESLDKLEVAYKEKKADEVEKSKKVILDFQKKMTKELGG